MAFRIYLEGKMVDETTVWTSASRIARDISTRLDSCGEQVDVVLIGSGEDDDERSLVASYINGTRIDQVDGRSIRVN